MAPTLYMIPPSPPVRSVQMIAKALGLQLQEKIVDMMKGEHLKPEYLKMNPQHTVPVLVDDDGFTIWESHAINIYLISKYAKNDALYPKDIKRRALIDQRLHFDSGVAFANILQTVGQILRDGKTSINEKDQENFNQVYEFLEVFLDGKQWIAGDSVTVADYNLYNTVTSSNVLVPIDSQKYPRLTKWIKNVDDLPEAEPAKNGLAAFTGMIKNFLK